MGGGVPGLPWTLCWEERALAGFEEEEEIAAIDLYGTMAADGLARKILLSVLWQVDWGCGESYL